MSTPIERAAEVIHEDAPHLAHNALGTHTTAREALAAALDVEEMARVLAPEDWRLADAPQYAHLPDEARASLTRRSLEQAAAIRAHVLGGAS